MGGFTGDVALSMCAVGIYGTTFRNFPVRMFLRSFIETCLLYKRESSHFLENTRILVKLEYHYSKLVSTTRSSDFSTIIFTRYEYAYVSTKYYSFGNVFKTQ